MFQLSGLAHKKYQFKEYLLASLFFLISATIAISIANITLFYNIYQSSHNFFNLVVMSRHPLSYFAYGVCGWFVICYVFALCYKGIKGNLLRVFLRFAFGAYLVISILLLIYYVLNYNVAFETFTLFDSFKLVISDNPGFLLINLGLLIFFILDRQINLRKGAPNKKQSPYRRLISYLAILIAIFIFNEAIVNLALMILGLDYTFFPFSIQAEYQLIINGQGLSLVFSSILILSGMIFLVGLVIRSTITKLLLMIPVTVFMGLVLSNLIYYLLTRDGNATSPLYMFSLYFSEVRFNKAYQISLMIGLFTGFVFAIICIKGALSSNNKVYGNSRFASYFDLLKYKMLKKQVESLFLAKWHNKALYANGYEHVLILAPSGSGKSSTYGIINLIEWQGSSVSNDLSGELYNKVSKYLLEVKKSKVFKFDPLSRLCKTHRWNIYHDVCNLNEIQRYGELSRIASLIIPENKGGHDSGWIYAARNGIECVSAYLVSTNGYCTLGDVAEICCRSDFDDWLKEALQNPKTDSQFKVRANAYLSVQADETRSGVKFNMDAHLGLYLNPLVRAATAYSDFNLSDLRREKIDVFFTVPQGQIQHISPLITMFWEELTYQMTLNEPKEDEPYAVFCNIDETGNMGRINNLRTGASYLRKYKLRITFYFQYKDQAGDLYSDREMKAFLNTKNKLLFTPSDDDDVEYISNMSGRITKTFKTKTRQGIWGQMSINEHKEKANLLEFNDVKYMSDHHLLIQVDGRYMIKATKCFYFKDRKYRFLRQYEIDETSDQYLPTQNPILPEVPKAITSKGLLESPSYSEKQQWQI